MCNFQPTIIALSEVTCNVQLEVRYSCFGFVHDDGEDWSSIPSLQGDVCWHWYWNTGYRAVYWLIFAHLYYNDEVLLARIEQFLRSLRDTFELGRDTWISLLLSLISLKYPISHPTPGAASPSESPRRPQPPQPHWSSGRENICY